MTIQEKIDVLSAFRDGKEIQVCQKHTTAWLDVSDPTFNFTGNNYRVKPEPRRIWVNEYPHGLALRYFTAKCIADIDATKDRVRVVEFVEVLE